MGPVVARTSVTRPPRVCDRVDCLQRGRRHRATARVLSMTTPGRGAVEGVSSRNPAAQLPHRASNTATRPKGLFGGGRGGDPPSRLPGAGRRAFEVAPTDDVAAETISPTTTLSAGFARPVARDPGVLLAIDTARVSSLQRGLYGRDRPGLGSVQGSGGVRRVPRLEQHLARGGSSSSRTERGRASRRLQRLRCDGVGDVCQASSSLSVQPNGWWWWLTVVPCSPPPGGLAQPPTSPFAGPSSGVCGPLPAGGYRLFPIRESGGHHVSPSGDAGVPLGLARPGELGGVAEPHGRSRQPCPRESGASDHGHGPGDASVQFMIGRSSPAPAQHRREHQAGREQPGWGRKQR